VSPLLFVTESVKRRVNQFLLRNQKINVLLACEHVECKA